MQFDMPPDSDEEDEQDEGEEAQPEAEPASAEPARVIEDEEGQVRSCNVASSSKIDIILCGSVCSHCCDHFINCR